MQQETKHAKKVLETLANTSVSRFCDASEFPETSRLSPATRNLPILKGTFPRLAHAPGENDVHLGWGTLQLPSDAWALTFRMQFGDTMHLWFANASDLRVWEVVDAWAARGRMVIASVSPNGKNRLAARNFELHPEINKLRSLTSAHEQHGPAFIEGFAALGIWDAFGRVTSSDLPQVRVLKSVHARIVSTERTNAMEGLRRLRVQLQDAWDTESESGAPPQAVRH